MTSENLDSPNQDSQINILEEPTITPLTCQEQIDCSQPDVYQESLNGAWDLKREYVVSFYIQINLNLRDNIIMKFKFVL